MNNKNNLLDNNDDQSSKLKKELQFKKTSIISLASALISVLAAIGMAYNGFGVWSLVAQNIIGALIPAVVFWFHIKWRPKLLFSTKSFKDLFSFGAFMFLTNLLNKFGNQIQGLLIGKMYNPTTMGYYSKAEGTEKLASTSISSIMSQVTYPLYAEAQDDKARLGNMIKRLTMTLSYMSFPLMFLLLLCAKPICFAIFR